MFRQSKIPFMFIVVGLSLAAGPFLPLVLKSFFYALSLSIKSCILFLLPFIIFGLLFKVAVNLAHQATKIILFILVGVCCSNFISTLISKTIGMIIYRWEWSMRVPQNILELTPLWSFTLPKFIANDKAMLFALGLGIVVSLFKPDLSHRLATLFEKINHKILSYLSYMVPFFIGGFLIKLHYDGAIALILRDYSLIFLVIFAAQFGYIMLIYLMTSHFNGSLFVQRLKNMLPSAATGLCTMSSASALPFTLIGTEKNTQNPALTHTIIPMTVNVHLIGDCFAIPILAYAVLKSYGLAEPSLLEYVIFAFYFVLAKFSVAAVPGGGILVMLPILESYLGFQPDMLSLITALYILFDPVITCANVLGNGGFALLMSPIINATARWRRAS